MIWGSPIFGNAHIKINGGTSNNIQVKWPLQARLLRFACGLTCGCHILKVNPFYRTRSQGCNQGTGWEPRGKQQKQVWDVFFSRWWFQICFTFTPKRKEDSHFDEHIFQKNLRNRRYYISWHQVSRSVSKSSGRIVSKRKNDTYIVYMYTVYMWDA